MAAPKSFRLPRVRGSATTDEPADREDQLRRARRRVKRLQAKVEAQQERIDELRERVRRDRPRDDLSYVFICTYGRSGSTLLQGLLNSIPGYLIRGENHQALRHLWQFHGAMMHSRRGVQSWLRKNEASHAELPVTHPFFGVDKYPDSAHRLIRKLALDTVLRPEPDTRVTGFKEIRWADDDVLGYLQFLCNVFPDARFIINTRNLDDVAQSAWWGDDPDARAVLQRAEARLDDIERELGASSYRVRYDEYVADPAVLRGLFDWLGEDFDLDAVRAVFDVEHSYQPSDDDEPAADQES